MTNKHLLAIAVAALGASLLSGNAIAMMPAASATVITDTPTELKIVWTGDLASFQSAPLVDPANWDVLGVYSKVTSETIFGETTSFWKEGISAQHAVAPHANETALGPVYTALLGGSMGASGFDSKMAPHNGGPWVSPANFTTPHWDHFSYTVASNADGTGTATLYALHPVPEPETYAMLMAGLGLMAYVARRRKNV